MKKEFTTKIIALLACDYINEEYKKNKFTDDWSFQFDLIKDELPNNFNAGDFFKIISDNVTVNDIKIEDLGYKIRVLGRLIVEKPILSMGSVADDFMKQAYSEAEQQLNILNTMQTPKITE